MLSSGDSHIATLTSTGSTFASDVTVGDELTITTISNATADPNKFLVGSGTNKVGYLTNSQVLGYIGAAPATGGSYLPLTGGVMTGNVRWNDAKAALFGSGQDMHIYHYQNENYIDTINY